MKAKYATENLKFYHFHRKTFLSVDVTDFCLGFHVYRISYPQSEPVSSLHSDYFILENKLGSYLEKAGAFIAISHST